MLFTFNTSRHSKHLFPLVPEGEGSTVYLRVPLPNFVVLLDSPTPPELLLLEREVRNSDGILSFYFTC